jgi:hypothetical protein
MSHDAIAPIFLRGWEKLVPNSVARAWKKPLPACIIEGEGETMPNATYNLIRELLDPERLEVERLMREIGDDDPGPAPALTPEDEDLLRRMEARFLARLRELLAALNAEPN